MATKVVYFSVGGIQEQAEFSDEDPADDVKEIFRVAAEAGPNDILKLYNTRDSLINISPQLAGNTPDTRYRLEVVAAQWTGATVAAELGFDIEKLEARLSDLESRIRADSGDAPQIVQDMKQKVESFREKLESVAHLSWLGLHKEISPGTAMPPVWKKPASASNTDAHCKRVFDKFVQMSQVHVTEEVREYLKKPTFDNWQWDDPEMLVLLCQMFLDLGLTVKFNIEMHVLQYWLYQVYSRYNNVPFHNFKHCFMVAQMMYGLIWLIDLPNQLEEMDILILLTSAICHDLDHPGYNNAYQINARTELALTYNDISPLENHHCSVAFEILEHPEANIFRNVNPDQFRRLREGMIKCILATDMSKHNDILTSFKAIIPVFDFNNTEHKDMLLMILLKVADISNEARPLEVASRWLERLLEEYFNQSDMEKLEGLPVAPFMDRDKVTKPASQTGFIKFVLLPLFESLADLFPVTTEHMVAPVRKSLEYYTDMQKALEEEKARKDQETNSGTPRVSSRNGMKGSSPLDSLPSTRATPPPTKAPNRSKNGRPLSGKVK